MTTKQVFTLSGAERDYLQAAVRCMMSVEAESCARSTGPATHFCDSMHLDACKVSRPSGICPLDHEQAADLLCMLGDAADVELHITAEFDEPEPELIGYEAAHALDAPV